MRKYLLATHGSFSGGIKSSLELIIGKNENIFVIEAYTGENKSIESEIVTFVTNLHPDDELIIFTDLMGGSITNQVIQYGLRKNVYVVSGLNLPLLLDIVLADPDLKVEEVIENGIVNAREQIIFVNKLIEANTQNSND